MKWRGTKHCERREGVAQRLAGEIKLSALLFFSPPGAFNSTNPHRPLPYLRDSDKTGH